jgi:hypothetical protein
LPAAFRKISRVGRLLGATKWYLSDDCLLAAKQVMYTVEYRRFYLRDVESIVVWPSRRWLWRPIVPGVLLMVIGAVLGRWNFTAGAIAAGLGLAWMALEAVLGPTAESRIRTTGATVDIPLVKRTRRAERVLGKIDAAVRAVRGNVNEQPSAPVGAAQPEKPPIESSSASAHSTSPLGDLT